MKYNLINPPKPFLLNQKVFAPLGLLYLGAVLKNEGHEVVISDMSSLDEPLIEADVYGISSTTPQFPYAIRVAEMIRCRYKNKTKVIIGGPHVTSVVPNTNLFDIIIRGEGESLITKTDNGVYQAEPIKDLDAIPFPARELINLKDYKYSLNGRPATHAITSRGCPFSCAYCDKEMWGKKVRYRSAGNVLKELDQLNKDYGYDAFMFFDDTFTLNKPRLEELCDGFKARGFIWRCFSRVDTVSYHDLMMMKEAGCYEIGVGIESCNQSMLDRMHKGTTVEQNTRFIKWTKELGIRNKAFLIMGFPGETRESLDDLINWVKEVKPDDFDLSVFMPIPGSDVWNNPKAYNVKLPDDFENVWYKGTPGEYHSYVVNNNFSTNELMTLRDKIERELKEYLGVKWD